MWAIAAGRSTKTLDSNERRAFVFGVYARRYRWTLLRWAHREMVTVRACRDGQAGSVICARAKSAPLEDRSCDRRVSDTVDRVGLDCLGYTSRCCRTVHERMGLVLRGILWWSNSCDGGVAQQNTATATRAATEISDTSLVSSLGI